MDDDLKVAMSLGNQLRVTDVLFAEASVEHHREGPFGGYAAKQYADPRDSPSGNIRDAVLDIITTDGPLPKASIYRLYRDGCPRVERAGKTLRQAVNRALGLLQRSGAIDVRDEGTDRDPAEVIVKLPSQPWIDRRPAGKRSLDDIPVSEIAECIRLQSGGVPPQSASERDALRRAVASEYGLQRLNESLVDRFGRAERLAFPETDGSAAALF